MAPRDVAFYDLRKIVSERSRPIVFWTGAGVSAPSMPSWIGLLKQLVAVAKSKSETISNNKSLIATIEAAKAERDLWVSFERLYSVEHGIGPESFRAAITKALSASHSNDVPNVQRQLWQLRPKGIVTLNLDLFTLRSSVSYSNGPVIPIQILPSQFGKNISVFKESRPFIAYPHGELDNVDSWTFTSGSLAARLSDKGYLSWITALFASHTVVFVGLTVNDVAVGGLLDRISHETGSVFRGNYWITGRSDSDTDAWAEDRGIRVLRYHVNGDDHADLSVLLQELHDFKAVENKALEAPISPDHDFALVERLPKPEEINLHDKEKLRVLLNGHALYLYHIYSDSEEERDKQFRAFLSEYEDAIHNSYSTSISPNRNEFLGYHLIEKANGGAFGTVYRAIDNDGKSFAIKILHAEKLENRDFYRNFRRGANSLRILSESKVDGIVGFEDAVEIPPSLIMEWIEGATLADAVFQPMLSDWAAKVRVLLKLAVILKASHALPERVLHRDLRPANIMLRDFYTNPDALDVVVLDFDLSWHRGAEDHSIMYSPAMGYLAPEQRRKIGKATTRTSLVDSYGFGMVMYFLTTREDPIPDMHRTREWERTLLNSANSNICPELRCGPRRVARLIHKCTREDQNERAQMSEIKGELEALLDYIERPTELSSISIMAEELATRIEHMQGYTWDPQLSKAMLSASAERATSIAADIAKSAIIINIDWMNAGTQDWTQINRLLEKGVPKILEALKAAGWSVSNTKQARSFHISAQISAYELVADVGAHAKAIDKALAAAFSMAGH